MTRTALRTLTPATMAVVLIGVLCTASAAQSRPYGDEGQYQVADPYLSAPNHVTDYPAAEVRAVPPAMARRAIARLEHYEAYNSLGRAIRDSQRNFDRSDEVTQAMEQERKAFEAYENARNEALKSLRDDEDYRSRMTRHQEMGLRIRDRHGDVWMALASDDAVSRDVVAMAAARLEGVQAVRQREQEALAKAPQVAEARSRLAATRARVNELRDRHADDVRSNPDLLAARQQLTEAKIARVAAEAYLEGLVEARNIALSYASYLHRYNPYQVSSYYGYAPFYGRDLLGRYR